MIIVSVLETAEMPPRKDYSAGQVARTLFIRVIESTLELLTVSSGRPRRMTNRITSLAKIRRNGVSGERCLHDRPRRGEGGRLPVGVSWRKIDHLC